MIQLQRSSEGEVLTVTLCLVACGRQYLFLTLGATLSAAAQDRGQCYSIGQMYPSTDRVSGRSECCPDGTEYNGNICEPLPTCFNPDEYFDTVDRVCRAKKDCGDGNYFYIRERKCKPIPPCLDDEFFDGQYCVRKPQCQDGYYFEKTGCVLKPRCEDDEWFDGRNCVEKPQDCGAGKHWDFKANQCVPNPPCDADSYWTGTGCAKRPRCRNPHHFFDGVDCVPCPNPDEYWNGNACVSRPVCAEDEYYDGNSCKKIPKCGQGQYWNRKKNICDQVQHCSLGEWFNGESCEAISYPPYGGRLCLISCDKLRSGTP
ncbi:unnamed protein product [Aspergillus oryzae]|nr:unnamed protein product [Aspergillus oryzae]GMF96318.1 unnamed protein product [Aspergillus oryzae]